jgi:uridine kinase
MPHLIGIGGPSCSGKTELARWISARTGAPVVNLDHYYVDLAHLPLEIRAGTNFDEPHSVDHDAIIADAQALRAGSPIHAPHYDFSTHTRAPGDDPIEPAGLIIFEGLFALYWPELRDHFALNLYVEAPDEVCLARRLERDVLERGRTAASVLKQYTTTVRPGVEQYIRPSRVHADLVLSGTDPIALSGERVLARVNALD